MKAGTQNEVTTMSATQSTRSTRGSMTNKTSAAPKTPAQNIAVRVVGFKIADKSLRRGSNDDDRMIVALEHHIEAFGITAEFDEHGVGITEIEVAMPKGDWNATRAVGIFEIMKGSGQFKAKAKDDKIFLEKVYKSREGTLNAGYVVTGPTAALEQAGRAAVLGNQMVCVLPEVPGYTPKPGQKGEPRKAKQQLMIADLTNASVVTSHDDISDAFQRSMDYHAQSGKVGTPGFQLHARRMPPADASPAVADEIAANLDNRIAAWVIGLPKNGGQNEHGDITWVPLTADETVEAFWKGGDAQVIRELLGEPGEQRPEAGKDWQFEMVPMTAVWIGPMGIASAQKPENIARGIGDPSSDFRVFEKGEDGKMAKSAEGWRLTNVAIQRQDAESDYWYAAYVKPAAVTGEVFLMPDIPTSNMDQSHVKAVYKESARLEGNASDYYNENRRAKAAPVAEADAPAP